MTEFVLFILFLVAPGTVEVRAVGFEDPANCRAIAAVLVERGVAATCERKPSA